MNKTNDVSHGTVNNVMIGSLVAACVDLSNKNSSSFPYDNNGVGKSSLKTLIIMFLVPRLLTSFSKYKKELQLKTIK